MEFHSHTLDNGLEIIAECNDESHSTGLGFFVRTGSRDESDEVAGVSHFLEHMVFKGTPRRSADDVNREFDEMGAHYNAFTGEENTVYYAAVLPECQAPCVDLLADILRPSLRVEDFDTEKQVIIEEIRMYDDQPPFGADDKLKAMYFRNHPLSRSILGSVDSITALGVEQMRDYFHRRYSPGNILLAGAGKLDFEALVKQAEQLCGAWQPVEARRNAEAAQPSPGFEVICRESAVQEYVLQMGPGPAAEDDDRYAAQLLATILGDDSGSRLYWELVDTGLAEHASVHHSDYEGTGAFMTFMNCDPDRAEENLQRMYDTFCAAEASGVTAQELKQAKSKWNSRIVLGSERPRNRLFYVGGNWIQRREYRSIKDDLDRIESLSLDEINAVQAKYPLSQMATLAIGPLEKMAAPV